MNENKIKEYVKIVGIVGGIILSSTSLVQISNYSKQQGDADLHDDYRESLQ